MKQTEPPSMSADSKGLYTIGGGQYWFNVNLSYNAFFSE